MSNLDEDILWEAASHLAAVAARTGAPEDERAAAVVLDRLEKMQPPLPKRESANEDGSETVWVTGLLSSESRPEFHWLVSGMEYTVCARRVRYRTGLSLMQMRYAISIAKPCSNCAPPNPHHGDED